MYFTKIYANQIALNLFILCVRWLEYGFGNRIAYWFDDWVLIENNNSYFIVHIYPHLNKLYAHKRIESSSILIFLVLYMSLSLLKSSHFCWREIHNLVSIKKQVWVFIHTLSFRRSRHRKIQNKLLHNHEKKDFNDVYIS